MNKIIIALLTLSLSFIFTSVQATESPEEQAISELKNKLISLKPIIFKASNEKHRIVVFTDYKCSYCARLQRNVRHYTDAGLTLMFMIAPNPTQRDEVMENMGKVWCSSDQQSSLQNAIRHGFMPSTTATPECLKTISDQVAMSYRLGIRGTPTLIVLSDKPMGFLGDVPPATILQSLADRKG